MRGVSSLTRPPSLTLIIQVPVDLQSSPTASPKAADTVPPWEKSIGEDDGDCTENYQADGHITRVATFLEPEQIHRLLARVPG